MQQINYNQQLNVFEYVVDGVVQFSSKNQQYLKRKIAEEQAKMNVEQPQRVVLQPQAQQVQQPEAPKSPKIEFTVEERFEFIERFTSGVADNKYLSLVLVGGPGLGKTHVVMSTLRDKGLVEIVPIEPPVITEDMNEEAVEEAKNAPTQTEGDFIVIKGFSTPKAMFRTLWENNGKLIIFDDADGAFRHPDSANILKGALDASDKRYISWGAEKRGDDDLPSRFEFTGRVIFISNLEMKDFPQAILSRAVHVDLALTLSEKVERIEQVLNYIRPKHNSSHVDDVIQLVQKYAPKFKELSIRTAMMLLKIREAEQDDRMFKRMALYNSVA